MELVERSPAHRRCDRRAAPIANGGLLEHVAVGIDFQRQRMLDARVGRVALVVVADRLAGMGEEDGVAVGAPGLQGADAEVLLGDGVGCAGALDLVGSGSGPGIIGIDLLAQHRALEGAAGFAFFFQGQAGGKTVSRQQQGSGFGVGQAGLAEVLALVGGVEQAGKVVGDVIAAEVDAGVEPGLGVHRRDVRCGGDVVCRGNALLSVKGGELLRVPLLHHAEAAELALLAVEVAVVVGVAGDEAVAADVVVGLDALDHMHRERQPGDPGFAVAFVLQVELGRGGVIDAGFGAEVVDGLDQQVRLLAAHQVDVAHLAAAHRRARAMTRPGRRCHCRAGRSVHDAHDVINAREDVQNLRGCSSCYPTG